MPQADSPEVTIVLPAYNEADCVRELTSALLSLGEAMERPFEILWVDDGSTDGTGKIIDELASDDGRIRVLHFSRNFGHMAALTAGLEHARASRFVITMDADGQHPPELIPTLVERWEAGADIVQTIRKHTGGESAFKRVTSGLFYRFINRIADARIPAGAADFRLMDRQVVDALNSLPERARFVRGLVHWMGFNVQVVPYSAAPRRAGATKYSFFRMLLLALSAITSFSDRPLRLAMLFSAFVSLSAFVYLCYVFGAYFSGIQLVPGWASTVLSILVIGGMQLVALAIASEYLARVYTEQKHRPVYILRREQRSRGKNSSNG